MNLQTPWQLLWMLPVVGTIVALYLLRMRRRDFEVPAVFLWSERLDEVRANSLFQRLRPNWLFALQVLAALVAVCLLARPQILQRGLVGAATVIVLDASASMGSVDVAPDRFSAAKKLVEEMIEAAGPGDQVALVVAGPTPVVAFPLSNDDVLQRRGLERVQRFDTESDIGEALRLGASLVGNVKGGRIVLVSDGAFEKVEDFSPAGAQVEYRQVGASGENTAIQALGSAEGASGRDLYCGIKNFGKSPSNVQLTLWADGKPIDSIDTTIGAGRTWGRTVRAPRTAKLFRAEIVRGGGKLAADDRAHHVVDSGASLRVLLVGPGDFFLERALVLDPRVTLDRAAGLPESESGGRGSSTYDIVVFDGIEEEPVRAPATLTLGRAGTKSPVTRIGTLRKPTVIDVTPDPITNGVSFADVYIESGEKVSLRGGARTLIDSDQGPILVAASGKKRQLYIAFQPLDSDLPLGVAFPILVANALDFLAPKAVGDTVVVRTAQPLSLPWAREGDAIVTAPGGQQSRVAVESGRLGIRGLALAGEHVVSDGTTRKRLFADLRSDVESAIEPRQQVVLGGDSVATRGSMIRFVDLWRPLALILLAVMAVEWWLFGRLS